MSTVDAYLYMSVVEQRDHLQKENQRLKKIIEMLGGKFAMLLSRTEVLALMKEG